MKGSDIVFYLLSVFILVNGVLAVTTRKIFRSAIFLLFTLIGIAGIYFWMQMDFIAAVQIIVYVGGIVVLIIFSIFLTQKAGTQMDTANLKRILFSILSVLSGFIFTILLISQETFTLSQNKIDVSPQNIGIQMLDYSEHGYALPFEVISILLLSAMIGCIVIAIKSPDKIETQKEINTIEIKSERKD